MWLTLNVNEFIQVSTLIVYGDPEIFIHHPLYFKKQSLVLINTEKIATELTEEYIQIKEIRLTKQYPRTLILKIIERQPLLKFQRENDIGYIDETGVILPYLTKYRKLNLPDLDCENLIIKNNRINEQKLIPGLKIVASFIKNFSFMISKVSCVTDASLIITVNNIAVIVLPNQSPVELVASLQLLFNQFKIESAWPEKIDLRFTKPVLIYKKESLL